MNRPTKEQIAEKRGLHLFSCVKCGNDVYYKYRVSKPMCESCKIEKHTALARARYLNRKYRADKVFKDGGNKFSTKYIADKLNTIREELGLSNKEMKDVLRILSQYTI